MATIVTHQPRPVPAFRRQHSACIAYRPSPLTPNQSQSFAFLSSMDLNPRSYRPNRPPQLPPSLHRHHHHIPQTPSYYPQHRTDMTSAVPPTLPYPRHTSPLSSAYPLVYSPSEQSYHTTPSMSADIQHEYPFDFGFATSSGMSFAELDMSQSAFLNPGQLPWSESKADFKVESAALDAQLFSAQPQFHPTPEMLTGAPQQVVYLSPAAESEMEMEGDADLQYPSPPPAPHSLGGAFVFVQPSEVMPPSPPSFAAPVPFPRIPGSSSPPGLTGESDEDMVSESGESEAADPSDVAEGDDDGDFMPSRMPPRTRSRRMSSVSVSSASGSVRASRSCRLGAPVPVPNLTKKSRGRRVPTTPVFMVQGGVQKNMRTYRCSVEGCYKCFARGEHLKRHVRSIHTNEKPHKCPVEGCGKDFSRHDNLGQHMRVHKGMALAGDS